MEIQISNYFVAKMEVFSLLKCRDMNTNVISLIADLKYNKSKNNSSPRQHLGPLCAVLLKCFVAW